MNIKKYIWPVLFSLCLILFTVYLMLDTFVIPKTYIIVEPNGADASEIDQSIVKPDDKDIIFTDSEYKDENISVTVTKHREYDSDIYVAEIVLSSPMLLKSAFANDAYGQNIVATTSNIAKSKNAIVAINGDFYGANNVRYVIRNGVLYRDTPVENREDLVIYKDGSFDTIFESEITAQQLYDDGAFNIFSFGPTLVRDERICVTVDDPSAIAIPNPRSIIGFKDENHIFFVVADGRSDISKGLTFYESAEFMKSIGATALSYNLDGGGSATMYFNGKMLNNPRSYQGVLGERRVSDIVYIGY